MLPVPFLLFQHDTGVAPLPLPPSGRLVAGRAPDCDIVLPDAVCSRRHFHLDLQSGQAWVSDAGSANGTLLNGKPIRAVTPLTHGDIVRAGNLELLYMERLPDDRPSRWSSPGEPLVVRSLDEMAQALNGDVQSALVGWQSAGEPTADSADRGRDRPAFAVLTQLGRILLNATTSTELLESAVDLIFQALRVHRAAIYRLEPDRALTLQFHRSVDETPGGFVASSSILERAVKERAAVLSGDAQHDPRFLGGQSIAAYSLRSVLAVPLWNDQEIYGVLYLDNLQQRDAFGDRELELVTGIANLLALGLKQHDLQSRLQEEAVRRSHLARYHSPDVVDLILSRTGAEAAVQSVSERQATILFSDIVGFTPLSERLRPAELAELLNWYFDLMTKVIFRHKGSVNKFIGDAIMAIFGAPISHGNDAAHAILAAQDMLEALRDFHSHIDERKRFQIRIGINTGTVIAGDIGARNRMEYTVIGDAVNTAQRIESIGRPNAVTIGAQTFSQVRDLFDFNDLGEKSLKGKTATVRAYEVLARRTA